MKFADYLLKEGVSINEMTVEAMVDKCIEEGKTKKGALECVKKYGYPKEISGIIKKMPSSMFEAMIETNVKYSEIMEEFDSIEEAIVDFITEEDDGEEEEIEESEDKDDEDSDEIDESEEKELDEEACKKAYEAYKMKEGDKAMAYEKYIKENPIFMNIKKNMKKK